VGIQGSTTCASMCLRHGVRQPLDPRFRGDDNEGFNLIGDRS
jgi:hypothetical protein